jgi:hypothetical protein
MNAQLKLLIKAGLTKDVLVALAREYFGLQKPFDVKEVEPELIAAVDAAQARVAEILSLTDEEVAERTEAYNREVTAVVAEPVDGLDDMADSVYDWLPENDTLMDLKDYAIGVIEDYAYRVDQRGLKPLSRAEWKAKMLTDAQDCLNEQKYRLQYRQRQVDKINEAFKELKNADF